MMVSIVTDFNYLIYRKVKCDLLVQDIEINIVD